MDELTLEIRATVWFMEVAAAVTPDAAPAGLRPRLRPSEPFVLAEPALEHVHLCVSARELRDLQVCAATGDHVGQQTLVPVEGVLRGIRGERDAPARAVSREPDALHVGGRLGAAALDGRAGLLGLGRVDPDQPHRVEAALRTGRLDLDR